MNEGSFKYLFGIRLSFRNGKLANHFSFLLVTQSFGSMFIISETKEEKILDDMIDRQIFLNVDNYLS